MKKKHIEAWAVDEAGMVRFFHTRLAALANSHEEKPVRLVPHVPTADAVVRAAAKAFDTGPSPNYLTKLWNAVERHMKVKAKS